MKVQNIQTIRALANNNSVAKAKQEPTFKGGADSVVKFWDAIGRGGFTANFLLQDLGGNNIPRVAISLNRNKEELGHLNYSAGGEALIRELLSGPSMVAVPLGVMALSTRLAGPATKIPTQNIKDFSQIMKNTLKNAGGGAELSSSALRKAFYTNVLDAAGATSLGGSTEFTAKALEEIKKIESGSYPKRGFLKKFLDKPLMKNGEEVKAVDQAISGLHTAFSKLRQQKAGYGEDFLSAQIAPNGKSTNFSDLISQMKDYFDDFTKKGLKANPEGGKIQLPNGVETLTDKFKNLRTGQRFVTGIAMTGLMMLVLTIIPKLYSFNKTSPEVSQVRKEDPKEVVGGAK